MRHEISIVKRSKNAIDRSADDTASLPESVMGHMSVIHSLFAPGFALDSVAMRERA